MDEIVGCAPDCSKDEHIKNGKCKKNPVRCMNKSECKHFYMTLMKEVVIQRRNAQEALRKFNTRKFRRLQAFLSRHSLEDTYAGFYKEY